jgi:hypothetical protein
MRLACVAVVVGLLSTAEAQDWSSCSYDLDAIRWAARDASYEAEASDSAEQDFEQARDDLQSCLDFPDVYDLLEDGCQSQRWEYDSARSEYESALSNLEYELSTVARKIRGAESSCDCELGRTVYVPMTETANASQEAKTTTPPQSIERNEASKTVPSSLVNGLPSLTTIGTDALGAERCCTISCSIEDCLRQ